MKCRIPKLNKGGSLELYGRRLNEGTCGTIGGLDEVTKL